MMGLRSERLQLLSDAGAPYLGFARSKLAQLHQLRLSMNVPVWDKTLHVGDITVYLRDSEAEGLIRITGEDLVTVLAIERIAWLDGGGYTYEDPKILCLVANPEYDPEAPGTDRMFVWAEGKYSSGYNKDPLVLFTDWQGPLSEDGTPTVVLTWAGGNRYWFSDSGSELNIYMAGKVFAVAPGTVIGASKRTIVTPATATEPEITEDFIIAACQESNVLKLYRRDFSATDSGDLYDETTAPSGWVLFYTCNSSLTPNGPVNFNSTGDKAVAPMDFPFPSAYHWVRFIITADTWTVVDDVVGINVTSNTLVTSSIATRLANNQWPQTSFPPSVTTDHSSHLTYGYDTLNGLAYPITYGRDTSYEDDQSVVEIDAVEYVGDNVCALVRVLRFRTEVTVVQEFTRPDSLYDRDDTGNDHGVSVSSCITKYSNQNMLYKFEENESLITLSDSGDKVTTTKTLSATLDYSGGMYSDPGEVTSTVVGATITGSLSSVSIADLRDDLYMITEAYDLDGSSNTQYWSAYEEDQDYFPCTHATAAGSGTNYIRKHRDSTAIIGSFDNAIWGDRFMPCLNSDMLYTYINARDYAMVESSGGYYYNTHFGDYYDLGLPRILGAVVGNPEQRPYIGTLPQGITDGPISTHYNRGIFAGSSALNSDKLSSTLMAVEGDIAAYSLNVVSGTWSYATWSEPVNYSEMDGLYEAAGAQVLTDGPATLRPLGWVKMKKSDIKIPPP